MLKKQRGKSTCRGSQEQTGNCDTEDLKMWRSFFLEAPQPIIVIDPAYRVLSANNAVLKALNKTAQEVVGSQCYELFHGSEQPVPGCPMGKLLSDGWSGTAEMEVQTLHGTFLISCIPIRDKTGKIIRVVHIAGDITGLKETQLALQESEEKYRSHFENISDIVFSMDRALRIVNISPSVEKVLGYTPEEMIGKPFSELGVLAPESMSLAFCNMKRILRGENNVMAEYAFITKNGTKRISEISGSPSFSKDRSIKGIIAVARDITERKLTEEALQESESKFRNLSEKSLAGVYLIQDDVFKYVNLTFAQVFGYTIDEMIDKLMPENVIFPPDWPIVRENLQKRFSGELDSLHYEFRIQTKDGEIKNVEAYSSRTTYKGKPAVIGTVLDITERKRTEEALLKSEAKYRSIFETAVEGIFQITPEGRFLNANPALARMCGYETPGELIEDITDAGQQLYANPADRELVKKIIKEKGVLSAFEAQFYRKDRTKIWVSLTAHAVRSADGTLLYHEGSAEDVTERKRSEEELRVAHQRLFDIIEFLPDATFVIDHEKKVVAWNRAIEEMTGVKKEEMIGKEDYAYAIPFYGERRPILIDCVTADPDELRENYKAVTRKGHVLYAESFVPGVHNGKGAFLSGNAAPLFDKDGHIVGAIECIRDITEFHDLETQLRQSQKMEAIGTLAGGVAHDFNNILTAIVGYGSILEMNMDDEDPRKQYLNQILISAEKAANLTKSLLAFSRKQAIELKPHALNSILKGIEKLLRRLLTEDIEFAVLLAHPDVVIMADITQIDQVLMNLATNARDAMPKGGRLVVAAEEIALDSEFVRIHGLSEPGGYALISVTDTGCGMDEKTKEKIFEPFFTTKEVGRGTGLGLSTVYGIVKQHNGYVDVDSEPDKGTVFRVYLPTAKMRTGAPREALQDTKGGNETILVAEDNAELRELLLAILKDKGYTVIEATNGEDAIRQFMRHQDTIDLLVLDVVMPLKNGKEVYDEVKIVKSNIKTIFMSGYTGDVVIEKGVHDRTVDFISKPLSPNELLLKVREVLDR